VESSGGKNHSDKQWLNNWKSSTNDGFYSRLIYILALIEAVIVIIVVFFMKKKMKQT